MYDCTCESNSIELDMKATERLWGCLQYEQVEVPERAWGSNKTEHSCHLYSADVTSASTVATDLDAVALHCAAQAKLDSSHASLLHADRAHFV